MPAAAQACPHCQVGERGRAPSALKIGALSLGASLALAIYIPGCAYGCPDGTCGEPLPPDAAALHDATPPPADAAVAEPDAAPALPDAAL